MSGPLLEIDGLEAGYRDTAILRGVSLAVRPGEIVCVVGPNGAGKSTVLKGAMGLLRIFAGAVRFAGEDITFLPAERRVGVGIGYVPQVANVFASLSVRENLVLGLRRRSEREPAIAQVLDIFPDLRPRLAARAGALSGGERQMLAFARCLILKPRLLLLDEPTAALSPLLVDGVFRKVAEIAARGTAVLLVEQNALRALEISSRAVVLANGANAVSGSAAELLANPRLKDLYLGGAPRTDRPDRPDGPFAAPTGRPADAPRSDPASLETER